MGPPLQQLAIDRESREYAARPVMSPEAEIQRELIKEEGMVANWRQAGSKAAMGFILAAILCYGCAGGQVESGGQPLQAVVIDEYMLTKAGFIPYKPNGLWTLLSNFSAYEFFSGNCIG